MFTLVGHYGSCGQKYLEESRWGNWSSTCLPVQSSPLDQIRDCEFLCSVALKSRKGRESMHTLSHTQQRSNCTEYLHPHYKEWKPSILWGSELKQEGVWEQGVWEPCSEAWVCTSICRSDNVIERNICFHPVYITLLILCWTKEAYNYNLQSELCY